MSCCDLKSSTLSQTQPKKRRLALLFRVNGKFFLYTFDISAALSPSHVHFLQPRTMVFDHAHFCILDSNRLFRVTRQFNSDCQCWMMFLYSLQLTYSPGLHYYITIFLTFPGILFHCIFRMIIGSLFIRKTKVVVLAINAFLTIPTSNCHYQIVVRTRWEISCESK